MFSKMILKRTSLHSLLLCVILVFKKASGINFGAARESSCFPLRVRPVDPDPHWLESVQKWYIPLSSLLDLYKPAHDILMLDYSSIPEYALYYDSCTEWIINGEGFLFTGYGGRQRFIRSRPVAEGTADYQSEWPFGMSGRAFTTLTDNRTFFLQVTCHSDNEMGWHVFSTSKVLPESTISLIVAHVTSLGFRPEFFARIRYDSCPRPVSPFHFILRAPRHA